MTSRKCSGDRLRPDAPRTSGPASSVSQSPTTASGGLSATTSATVWRMVAQSGRFSNRARNSRCSGERMIRRRLTMARWRYRSPGGRSPDSSNSCAPAADR